MSHKVESMAYVNEKPWHGLGAELKGNPSAMEIYAAAGLDWKVNKVPLKLETGEEVPNWSMLVRSSDKRQFGICGKDYVPTQNDEVFNFFERFCKAGKLKMETAGALEGGRRVWGLAKVGDGFSVQKTDDVSNYLLLSSPHIYGHSLRLLYTPIRVVCWNTLTQALRASASDDVFRMIHSVSFEGDIVKSAERLVNSALTKSKTFQETANLLSNKKAADGHILSYLVQVLAARSTIEASDVKKVDDLPRNCKQVYDLIGTQPGHDLKSSMGTWWGVFNAVTFYFDHLYGKSQDNRLNQAWFGHTAALKTKALNLAVNYAKG